MLSIETEDHELTATGVLKHVCSHWCTVNHVFHVLSLVNTHSGKAIQDTRIYEATTISNNADDDLEKAFR